MYDPQYSGYPGYDPYYGHHHHHHHQYQHQYQQQEYSGYGYYEGQEGYAEVQQEWKRKKKKKKKVRVLPDVSEVVTGVLAMLVVEVVEAEVRNVERKREKRKKRRKKKGAGEDAAAPEEQPVVEVKKKRVVAAATTASQPKTLLNQLLEQRRQRSRAATRNLAKIIRTTGLHATSPTTIEAGARTPTSQDIVVETATLVRAEAQKQIMYLEKVKRSLTGPKAVRFAESSSSSSSEEEETEWPDISTALRKPKKKTPAEPECRTIALHSHTHPWKVAVGLLHKLRGERGLPDAPPIAAPGSSEPRERKRGRRKQKEAPPASDSGWETVGSATSQGVNKEVEDKKKKQMRKKVDEQPKFLVLGTQKDKERAKVMAAKVQQAIANEKEESLPATTVSQSKRMKNKSICLADMFPSTKDKTNSGSDAKHKERSTTPKSPWTASPATKPSTTPLLPPQQPKPVFSENEDAAWPALPVNPAYKKIVEVEKEKKKVEAKEKEKVKEEPEPRPTQPKKTGGLTLVPAKPKPTDPESEKEREPLKNANLRHLDRGKQKELAVMAGVEKKKRKKKLKKKKRSRLRTVVMREVMREKERLQLLILEAEGLLKTPKEFIVNGGILPGGVVLNEGILVPLHSSATNARKRIKLAATQQTEQKATEELKKYLLPENPLAEILDPRGATGSKHVREYVSQVLSSELDELVVTMMRGLQKFQAKLKQEQPKKYKARMRYVIGLKECHKAAQLKKLKAAIIVPDIQVSRDRGGLDDIVGRILESCREMDVPVIFAHSKDTLGVKCFGIALRMTSCIGIYSADGANDVFAKILRLGDRLHEEYVDALAKHPDLHEASITFHKTSRELLEQREKELHHQKLEDDDRRRKAREAKYLEVLAASAAKRAAKSERVAKKKAAAKQ